MSFNIGPGANRLIFSSARKMRWGRLRVPMIFFALFGLIAIALHLAGVVYNNTPSEPVGFYWVKSMRPGISSIKHGDKISFCPPVNRTNYPFLERGSCPGGTLPFFKTVVGVAGDVVAVSVSGVYINGRVLPDSAPTRSLKFKGMRHAYGILKLRQGQIWTYGSGAPKHSFDSRYWGVLDESAVVGVVSVI